MCPISQKVSKGLCVFSFYFSIWGLCRGQKPVSNAGSLRRQKPFSYGGSLRRQKPVSYGGSLRRPYLDYSYPPSTGIDWIKWLSPPSVISFGSWIDIFQNVSSRKHGVSVEGVWGSRPRGYFGPFLLIDATVFSKWPNQSKKRLRSEFSPFSVHKNIIV